MTFSITPLNDATFVVVGVSKTKQEFTNSRKDGTKFTTSKWALTLMPTLNSGFGNEFAWHLWTASDEVAETAREFLDTQELTVNNEDGSVKVVRSPRLAFLNGQADFKFGDAKPNQWTDKDGNPVVGRDKVTVWLDKDCEPDFGVVEMPKSRDAGNISDIKLGVVGIRRPQRQAEQAESSDEPF